MVIGGIGRDRSLARRGCVISKSWDGGSTRQWRERVRAPVLARDGYRCRAHADGWCDLAPGEHQCDGDGMATVTHAHHIYGRAVTGDDQRFIVASCQSCNLHIGEPGKHNPPPKRVSRW